MRFSGREAATSRNTRRVCVFTGSRADYGPLRPLLYRLRDDPDVDLRILVSGGHLVADQGMTVGAIERDGFAIDECVDAVLASDSPAAVSKSFGLACIGLSDGLERVAPDILVVLGDRYEALAAALVAMTNSVTLAHIGGGQLTYGSNDDAIRHAITKLAHLHFTVTAADCRRVIQMGEDPSRVFRVGPIGLDRQVLTTQLLDRADLERDLGVKLRSPTFLVTYHPATSDPVRSQTSVDGLIKALDKFAEATLIITAPNVDSGSRNIADRFHEYVGERKDKAVYVASLGQVKYLSLLQLADVVVGNSSSGVIEAPIVGTPTVNVGSRQDGREKGPSVVDCGETSIEIFGAINRCLTKTLDPDASTGLAEADRGLGLIVDVLKSSELPDSSSKRFFELPDYAHGNPTGSPERMKMSG